MFTSNYTDGKFCRSRLLWLLIEPLIEKWNEVMGPDDTVVHLGDFTLGDVEGAESYFRKPMVVTSMKETAISWMWVWMRSISALST